MVQASIDKTKGYFRHSMSSFTVGHPPTACPEIRARLSITYAQLQWLANRCKISLADIR